MIKRDTHDTCTLLDAAGDRTGFLLAALRAAFEAPVLVWRYRSQWAGNPTITDSSLRQWLTSAIKVSMARSAITGLLPKDRSNMVFYSYWRLEAAAALALMREQGLISNFFSRAHGGDLYFDKRYPFENLIHEYANSIFPVSDSGFRFLTKHKGFSAANLKVQRLGVTIPDEVATGSSDGVLRIVSCSNIIPVKRVAMIARHLSALPCEVDWVHFGSGIESPQVEAEVSKFDQRHRAVLKGGVPNSAIHEFYRSNPIDLFVNLSESEGVPVSIMEALAYGIPTIATDVGGTGEIVDDSCGALLTKDFSHADFTAAVSRLMFTEARSTYRMRARQQAENLCDAKQNYPITCDIMIARPDS
jgi:glycosyltransferase involved in cell wall biosynthesis